MVYTGFLLAFVMAESHISQYHSYSYTDTAYPLYLQRALTHPKECFSSITNKEEKNKNTITILINIDIVASCCISTHSLYWILSELL